MSYTTKTRSKSACQLSNLIGKSSEFLPSELPTSRDILNYGLYLREISEKNYRNYTVDQLVKDIIPGILLQWKKANSQIINPVINSERRIKCKVKDLWLLAVKVSNCNVSSPIRNIFMEKLDKLFDLFTCNRKILFCLENNCEENCDRKAHIVCTCKKEKKIPLLELYFVRYQ